MNQIFQARKKTYLRIARENDANAIRSLYTPLQPTLREMSDDELKAKILNQQFFVAEISNEIVGACYCSIDKNTEKSNGPFTELGGILVSEACQGYGLGYWLALYAMSNVLIAELVPDETRTLHVFKAHVLQNNDSPRSTLQKLGFDGFEDVQNVRYDKYPGLGHMPRNDNNFIQAYCPSVHPSKHQAILDQCSAALAETQCLKHKSTPTELELCLNQSLAFNADSIADYVQN